MNKKNLILMAMLFATPTYFANANEDELGHGETDFQYAWQAFEDAKNTVKAKYLKNMDLLSRDDQIQFKKDHASWLKKVTSKCNQRVSSIPRRMEREMEINRCKTDAFLDRAKFIDNMLNQDTGSASQERIANAPSYARIFPTVVKKTKTPVLLPDQHAIDKIFDRSVIVSLESCSPKHYSIKFERELGCQTSHCLAGALHVYQGDPPKGILSPQYSCDEHYVLKLAQGITANLEKEHGGGVNGKNFRWLKWKQGETNYALTIKDATESDFKTLANSAIRTGSWR